MREELKTSLDGERSFQASLSDKKYKKFWTKSEIDNVITDEEMEASIKRMLPSLKKGKEEIKKVKERKKVKIDNKKLR